MIRFLCLMAVLKCPLHYCRALAITAMSQNRKKPLVASQSRRKPLSKAMLLPHTAGYVGELVLRNHVALAAFRAGKGNGELLAELAKALYLAWYLQEAGFDAADRERYLEAERILDNAARNAHEKP